MIVDLGAPHIGTIEHIAGKALDSLASIRQGFPDVVAVSFLFNDTRVSAWPDDTVRSVFERWAETRQREQDEREEDRKHASPGYVGKHRA